MSKIGKKPILIPEKVDVKLDGNVLIVTGEKGEQKRDIPANIELKFEENKILVKRTNDEKQARINHGATRAHIANMITGVSTGFERKLILDGVGYKMTKKDSYIEFALGFSHPIYFRIPEEMEVEVTNPINNVSSITLKGINKEQIGLIADKIRSLRKPEPYKGKGFHYSDEVIQRKAGKTAN